ncbi:hypothetical protein ACFO3O_19285 [Dokdonia ponticola]|uniref:Tetratricopeptide repeat protein n=1 Tax=Dokdonia ponticola TaxID=2041041 RepID=A0ABV9I0V0_9FLAO
MLFAYKVTALKLLKDENDLGAITVFKREVETYPKYIGLMTNLAKLYEKTKQENKAIATYRQAMALSKRLKLGQEEDFKKEINRLRND